MTTTENIYRSILAEISTLPPLYLKQVNQYVQQLSKKAIVEKEANRQKVLSFAGSWNDMSDDDFAEYLQKAKETGKTMFKDIEF